MRKIITHYRNLRKRCIPTGYRHCEAAKPTKQSSFFSRKLYRLPRIFYKNTRNDVFCRNSYSTLLLLATCLFFSFIASADAEVPAYTLNREKSSLKFYAINNGAPVEGSFKSFSADIKFDPGMLKESKIVVTVETGSVLADYDEVATSLKSKEWLAVTKFPKAVFTSKTISRMPYSDNYYADGTLTLRDKTIPVNLNFQVKFVDDKKKAIVKGFVTLRRSDFGVGQGEWAKDDVVKNEVRVEFRVVAVRKQENGQ